MGKAKIRELALANGFKLKQQPDGTMELNPYVYEFAAALMAEAGRAGFIAGYHKMHIEFVGHFAPSGSAEHAADQYAERIRQEVK